MSAVARRRPSIIPSDRRSAGSVALLYLTCDDFDPRACFTLLEQQGVECDVFILDDSTQPAKRQEIDLWAAEHHPATTTVRRPDRSGYKAGNLNHWLGRFGSAGYPYMLVADADEHLPRDFTRRLVACLEQDGHAFAQGCHTAAPGGESTFQRLLELEIDYGWFHQVMARDLLGSAPMLGHGVLLRTDSVIGVGGFPALVSEDLALTIRLSERGLAGRIVPDAIAAEGTPESFRAYWTRKRRWIEADAEVLRRLWGSLLAGRLGWPARLDLVIRELRLPLGTAQWLLLAGIAVAGASGGGGSGALPPASWALLGVMLAPALTALTVTRLRLERRVGYVAAATFVGAATSALHPVAAARGLRGHGQFEPTGAGRRPVPALWVYWEALSAALFLTGGAVGGNLCLLAVGFAVACSPLMRTRLENVTLAIGLVVFWALLATQIGIDLQRGDVPPEHLLVLLGLLIT